jgi:hypothetical protein
MPSPLAQMLHSRLRLPNNCVVASALSNCPVENFFVFAVKRVEG